MIQTYLEGVEKHLKGPMTRRKALMLGGAGVAAAGVGGLAWFGLASPEALVFEMMRRALPGVDLDRRSCMECASDIVDGIDVSFQDASMQRLVSNIKMKGIRMTSQVVGLDPIAGLGPVEERVDEITRLALTRLLPNSNFFFVDDPKAETIYFRRPDINAPCGNPFADLSPPSSGA